MKNYVKILAVATAVLLVFTGCSSKRKASGEADAIQPFEIDELSARKPRETLPNDGSNTGLVYDLSGQSILVNEKSEGNDSNLDLSNHSDCSLAELELIGNDTSQYYAVVNNERDIQFGAVTYIGLNEAVNSIRTPYDKTTFINFIVKTYAPTRNKVVVSFINEEDPDTVPYGMSIGVATDLELNWDGYPYMLTKYGSDATWSLSLYEADTFGRPASLYGCKDWMIYSGTDGIIQIDMSKYQNIKPYEDTAAYIAPENPEGEDNNYGDNYVELSDDELKEIDDKTNCPDDGPGDEFYENDESEDN